MFRMGRDQKGETPQTEETADHTPAAAAGYGGGNSAYQASSSPLAASQTTSRAVTESESLARDIKEGTLSGFVGNGTVLTGEASFKGMLRVDGHLSGRVSSADGTLIISTNGQVDADIEVAVAQIFGTVNGDIIASKRIEMGRVAKVTGNIQTPALVIENGALFEGSCRMVQLKQAQERPRADESYSASAGNTAAAGNGESESAATEDDEDSSELSDVSGISSY